jgi:LPS export ABC transporter protein LptC
MVNLLAEREQVPSLTAKKFEILYTENGNPRILVEAPETEYFQHAEEPYYEFPKGITVFNYDDSLKIESTITANYAIFYEKKELWIARYDVVAQNRIGQILNTEQLYWDQKSKKIYSEDMVKITSEDDIIFGEGFDSDENFDNWVIRKISGSIYLDEEE